jgi:hypothetical protein
MIIINDKKIDSLNKDEAFVRKIYEPQMKWLKSLKKKYFVFTFPDNKVRMDAEGNIHTSNGSWVPFRQRYMSYGEGSYDVIYYKTSFYDAKHGREMYRPRKWDFRGTIPLNFEVDADLIWFLIFISPHMELSDWLKESKTGAKDELGFNRVRSTVYYKLENKVRDAEKDFAAMAEITRVMNALYDDKKGLTGEQLVYVARSYNVPTDGITDGAIRSELGKRVLITKNGKYNKDLINEFLERIPEDGVESTMDESVVAQAVVNDLIELGMAKSVQKGTKMDWVTDTGNFIVKYTPSQDGTKVLIDHLTRNPEARAAFEQDVKKRREELEPNTQPVT